MSAKLENVEKNKVKLTVEISSEAFSKALQDAYLKNRSKINLPGFRKGKAPRQIIEAQYGKEFFYNDAVNDLLPQAFETAAEEHKLDIVSRPEADVVEASREKGAVLTFEVYTKPVVTVETYKGLPYKAPQREAAPEEIDEVINKDREKNSRILTITDRPIQNGDIAIIDFDGYVDGVPFEGGKSQDYKLTIGSHSFIDNFEDQLIGQSIGDELDVNVTFPAEYHAEELAGKPALFKVTVKGINEKELPEVNDEFAQDVSEYDTLESYKDHIKQNIEERKAKQAESDVENQLMDALIQANPMDVPDCMFENEIDMMVREMSMNIRRQGLTLEQYMSYTGMDEKAIRDGYRSIAEKNVKGRLVLEAIVNKENFEVQEEEVEEEIRKTAETYQMELDKLKEVMRESEIETIKKDIKMRKALKMLKENGVAE